MSIAIRLERTGGPSVLETHAFAPEDPREGEVWIEHEAIGVNYLDVMQRKGTAPLALPGGIGLEAAGRVTKTGTAVTDVEVGDRVAYILGPAGAYSSGRRYAANRLIKLPADISFDDAASLLFKGITAQYLIKSTYLVTKGTVVVVYGAAGGVGQILASWAKHLGAYVIGVVSKEASIERARAAGCDTVLVWGPELSAEVSRATEGAKAHVVYDGVGKDTFAASLDCLRPRGMLASIGASSGAPPAVEMSTLNAKGSLFVTRPGLAAHASDLAEYRERAADVFAAFRAGMIKPAIWKTYALEHAAEAHQAIDDGLATGAVLLKP